MNRLILRIFLFVTVVSLATSAATFWLVTRTLEPQDNQHIAGAVAPGLRDLSERIAQGEPAERVIDQARRDVGDNIAVLPLPLAPLNKTQREQVRDGDILVLGGLFSRRAYAVLEGGDEVIELELASLGNSSRQWVGLRGTRDQATPLDHPPELSPLQSARLRWHPIKVGDDILVQRDGTVYQLDAPPRHPNYRWIGFVLSLLGTAIAIAASLLPVRRQLLRLAAGARAIEQGDLSARVELGRGGAIDDVSRQFNAMADQIEALVASHEELLQSVSHELRTPVARLLFSLDTLDDGADPEQHAAIVQMRQTALEMKALTGELLQFNRLGDKAGELTRHPVDLCELAEDVAVQWEGTELVHPGRALMVSGDPRLLTRVLTNLVTNAVRYASPPTVTLGEESGRVVLTVDDDGPGIPVAERERVFTPFVRLEASRSRDTGGSGLGLAIVGRIVQRHGGAIALQDSPLGGLRVRIELPALTA